MTNNWTDIGNSTLIVTMGANPSENHPACMAHVNKAREGGLGHPKAKLIVIDPRKTRTATQADMFVRIRPGTDIAFINGLVNYIINNVSGNEATNMAAFLNENGNQSFKNDAGAAGSNTAVPASKYTDARILLNAAGTDYERVTLSGISNFPQRHTTTYNAPGTVFSALKAHVAPYTTAVVADICGCTEAELIAVANEMIANSRHASYATGAESTIIHEPKHANYRCSTILYAMGATQHTCGGQNVKDFAVIQTLLGNMGRPGGGINALRGIHNVQGSTDMGLLYGNIPAYSGNPSPGQSFGDYMDKLWGFRLSGNSYADAYNTTYHGLQQAGFWQMTRKFFGDTTLTSQAQIDAIWGLWPKGNGDDHVTMFRKMDAGWTKAAVVWGQNPAITEPNQGMIRDALYNLDTLVCTDIFANETALASRKPTGVTYLIPACSYVEEAGSVTNSGRVLQWRERTTKPLGNTKADIELLHRFAYALDKASAFAHIKAVWDAAPIAWVQGTDYVSVYDKLYGSQNFATPWDPTSLTPFEDVSMADVEIWTGTATTKTVGTVTGSEAVCEKIFREMASQCNLGGATGTGAAAGTPSGTGGDPNLRGTIWIYTLGWGPLVPGGVGAVGTGQGGGWTVCNRAKSRDNSDNDPSGLTYPTWATANNHLLFKNWGYAWLVNRRVLYTNGDCVWDQADGFQTPDKCARFFVPVNVGVQDYANANYRTIHALADKPDVVLAGSKNINSPHFMDPGVGTVTYAGRFPSFVEPYETPRTALAATWGRNTRGGSKWDLLPNAATYDPTSVYTPDDVDAAKGRTSTVPAPIMTAAVAKPAIASPLVLTTIRCVEHFQGGPITRNNAWNVEAEPEPWVEINSVDAAARGILDGQWVNVYTVRGDSINSQEAKTVGGTFAQGFRARVGVGLQSNQRTGTGVVAIPWHWGDKGLSTGSRANDLCLDAGDANTTIPEYKACVCWIKKA